jgi:K+-sensing histidine kinase KdpD
MITFAQILFLTDKWIDNMSMIIRSVLFFGTVMIVMVIMIIVFNWFPIGDMYAWGGFVISYTVSMITSALLTRLKERTENSKMQEALDKYNRR